MSECICGKCPSTFGFSDSEDSEYLCLVSEERLGLERRVCLEQLDKMNIFNVVNTGKKPTDEQQKFIELNTKYWKGRKEIIETEFDRRGKNK